MKQELHTREGRNPRLLRRGGCQPVIRVKGSTNAIETLFLNEKTIELIMFRSLFEHDEPTPINPPNHQEPALAEFL